MKSSCNSLPFSKNNWISRWIASRFSKYFYPWVLHCKDDLPFIKVDMSFHFFPWSCNNWINLCFSSGFQKYVLPFWRALWSYSFGYSLTSLFSSLIKKVTGTFFFTYICKILFSWDFFDFLLRTAFKVAMNYSSHLKEYVIILESFIPSIST